jgi:hypothetical protein
MSNRNRSKGRTGRWLLAGFVATGAVVLPGTGAMAQGATPPASCVAIITSFEATQFEHGFVGGEARELATNLTPFGATLVSGLAQQHLGSIADCRGAEEG